MSKPRENNKVLLMCVRCNLKDGVLPDFTPTQTNSRVMLILLNVSGEEADSKSDKHFISLSFGFSTLNLP